MLTRDLSLVIPSSPFPVAALVGSLARLKIKCLYTLGFNSIRSRSNNTEGCSMSGSVKREHFS
jgi:hypothetical protein